MSNYSLKKRDYSSLDKNIKIAFVSAEWNRNYTQELEDINESFLKENNFENIEKFLVPGAFEIPQMVQRIKDKLNPDIIISFGIVIRGETTHYDMVAGESARGLMDISLKNTNQTTIINGILTCENEQQVKARISNTYAISGLNLLVETLKLENNK